MPLSQAWPRPVVTHMAFPAPPAALYPVSDECWEASQDLERYGVGVDTHSRFIQVCIKVREQGSLKKYQRQFDTTPHSLQEAERWIRDKLGSLANPRWHYNIESTGCYHFPVIRAWPTGIPHIVNPSLANPSRRKTDVLDADLLSTTALQAMWPESYLLPPALRTIRAVLQNRVRSEGGSGCVATDERGLGAVANLWGFNSSGPRSPRIGASGR
jgi:hypothetical protein